MTSPEFDALMATTQLEREKADDIRSLVAASKLAAKYEGERDAALAALARVGALLGDHDGPLWAVRGVREADIRAALEPTQPKGKP